MNNKYLWAPFVIIFISTLVHSSENSSAEINRTINYYAYFNRIVNTDDDFVRISKMEMSGDGEKIIFSGADVHNGPALYTVNTDGTELTKVQLTDEMGGITELTINHDGSRAYFYSTEHDAIYRVEANVCKKIFETKNYNYVGDIFGIETTADGMYVYFQDYQNDIWVTDREGGLPARVISDELVQRDKGFGAKIEGFDISDDGNNILFRLLGYTDQDGWFQTKEELFVYSNGYVKQITNHLENTLKESFSISGDGKTIVYSVATPENKWYSIMNDTDNPVEIGGVGFNFAGLEISQKGGVAFYNDAASNGGRIVNCNGEGCLDLFDGYGKLVVSNAAQINDSGNVVSFIHQYASFPMKEAIYVGYIKDEETTSWSPRIKDINFDPDFMPKDNPDAIVNVLLEIRRDDSFSKLEYLSGANVIDGILNVGWTNTPIVWGIPFHDDGQEPDLIMNDEIFTTTLGPGDLVDDFSAVTIRAAAMDSMKNMVVSDVILGIGGTVGIFKEDIKDDHSLSQNYPNPFNPVTKIKYSISALVKSKKPVETPAGSKVMIVVYDILGREITTLVNERQKPGNYEIIWNAGDIPSGVYLYQLSIGNYVETKKMVYLK